MNKTTLTAIAAGALVALAAWPAFVARNASATEEMAAAPTPAPVRPDYLYRNAIVNDFEIDVRRHPDQLVTRMLASQYLQRYRETVDVGDLLRAVSVTKQSLALQPRFNVAAESTMASADTALHRFHDAKAFADDVVRLMPWDGDAIAADASAAMELGDYRRAARLLEQAPGTRNDAGFDTAAARYDELTGKLSTARRLTADAMQQVDSGYDNPAEGRAWYHWRAGELAFEAGDFSAAEADYRESLAIFPSYWHAYNGLAKLNWAQRHWSEARDAAAEAAAIYPQPETLGYAYDAQAALGEKTAAAQTRDLIFAIERIGNAQGLSDRLIAMFEADHALRSDDAVAIAQRDLARRDDIYAEDTLGWALASAGQWQQAKIHAERAVRFGTEDARLQYHAGIIALHCADRDEALRRLRLALQLNPDFHPYQAADARRILSEN